MRAGRRGAARELTARLSRDTRSPLQILELDADNKDAKRELAALKRKQRERDQADAQVFGKVFGKLAKQGLYSDVKVTPGAKVRGAGRAQ